jgi:hypothetical protein
MNDDDRTENDHILVQEVPMVIGAEGIVMIVTVAGAEIVMIDEEEIINVIDHSVGIVIVTMMSERLGL